MKRTMRFLQRNVVEVAGDQVHVFACLQNDGQAPPQPQAQQPESWDAWFATELGGYLQSLEWMDPAAEEWTIPRDRLLSTLHHVPEQWRDYLRHSGSMVEYYQLYRAYLQMCGFEAKHGFRFDWIIRTRTDSIFTQPIDFHWLEWSEHTIQERMDAIRQRLPGQNPTAEDVWSAYMSTLISDKTIPNLSNLLRDPRILAGTATPKTAAEMGQYVREGRYILTFRRNNLYVVRRDLFYLIPSLATLYGTFRSPESDDYWFNAEGQFRDACTYSGLSVFDYSTVHEERSLDYAASWQNSLFFDEAGEPKTDPPMVYVVVRTL